MCSGETSEAEDSQKRNHLREEEQKSGT